MIITVGLVNTCITSHNFHFFLVVRTFEIFTLSNFHVYNTVLLTISPCLHRFPEFIDLITGSLYPLATISLLPLLLTILPSVLSVSSGFLDSTCKLYDWVLTFSDIFQVARIFSFLRLNNIPVCIYRYLIFICSSIDGHLGYSHILAIVNNTAVNMGVQIPLQDPDFIFFRCILRSEIVGSYGISVNIWRNFYTVFHDDCTNLYSHQKFQGVPFFLHLCQYLFFLVFLVIAIVNPCEVIPHCDSDLHFSDD